MEPVQAISLVEAMKGLREQMEAAIQAAKGKGLQFEANEIKMEFRVGVTRSADVSGGVQFWVIQLGGKTGYSSEALQTLTLSLKPVGDGRTLISGTQSAGPEEEEQAVANHHATG